MEVMLLDLCCVPGCSKLCLGFLAPVLQLAMDVLLLAVLLL